MIDKKTRTQTLKLVKSLIDEGKTVKEAAEAASITLNTYYRWVKMAGKTKTVKSKKTALAQPVAQYGVRFNKIYGALATLKQEGLF